MKKREEGGEEKKDANSEYTTEESRDFKLKSDKPIHYVYSMYKSHVYEQRTTWGDVYRLFKYFRRFHGWDTSYNSRTFTILPAKLTKEQLG